MSVKHSGLKTFLCIVAVTAFFLVGCSPKAVRTDRPQAVESAVAYEAQGVEAYGKGDADGALRSFIEALRLNRSIDNRRGEAADLINISRAELALGMTLEAKGHAEEAISAANDAGDGKNMSEAYSTLSMAKYALKDYDGALKGIEDSLAIDGHVGYKSGSKLNLKGLILMESGRIGAEDAFKDALEANRRANDKTEEANSLRALGEIYATGKPEEALESFKGAYEIDAAAGDPGKIALDLESMAVLHRQAGRTDEALKIFERAYKVSLNSGLYEDALESIDAMIGIYEGLNERETAERYMRIRDGVKKQDEGR
ncbi:MAG: tetratricopeptide repeat protein [Deltaproteobacteria bacterium]|nr:tetratricopeptide repeat protein [Deltaproteobacteria bacterium]